MATFITAGSEVVETLPSPSITKNPVSVCILMPPAKKDSFSPDARSDMLSVVDVPAAVPVSRSSVTALSALLLPRAETIWVPPA